MCRCENRRCRHCDIELNKVKHEGLQCKTCRNGLNRYNLNRKQQIQLLESQNYKCALCESVISLFVGNNQSGVIDHCHKTGKVRGVICSYCNVALGRIEHVGKDKFLKNLLEYLS